MAKQLTTWRKQGQSAASGDYDGASIDYDSSTQSYGGNNQGANSVIKQRTTWEKEAKQRSVFTQNPAADANDYAYNSASIVYNTSRSYNGVVSGESRITTKKPTAWSKE